MYTVFTSCVTCDLMSSCPPGREEGAGQEETEIPGRPGLADRHHLFCSQISGIFKSKRSRERRA